MKTPIIIVIVLVLSLVSIYYWTNRVRTISKDEAQKIKQFLSTVAANTIEQDYKRHSIHISAVITKLQIYKITGEEKPEYILYTTRGRISYIIQGNRDWIDQEGNRVQLGPEREITHNFACGVREDRFGFWKDDKERLEFYADDVIP